jgi:hypothetical protein
LIRASEHELSQDLAGRIVLIGDFSPANTFYSGTDEWPGPILQANYIEALLDRNFYVPLSFGGFSLLYIAGLAFIQRAFWKWHSPERTAIFLFALVVVGHYLLLQIHLLLDIWKEGVSVGAIAIKWIETRGHITAHQKE